MFKDPSGLASENEMGGNNVQTISGIDRIVSTFEEIFTGILSIFGSGGGGDGGFHSPEARAARIRAHDEIRERGEHKQENVSNGRTMVRGGAEEVSGGVGGFYTAPTNPATVPTAKTGNGNAKVNNPSDVKTLLKVAERHLSVAINNTKKDGYEWGGYLVGNSQMSWVRWANFHTDELPSGILNGISIQDNGIGIPNFSYGEVVLARVHTHPNNSSFSDVDIGTFAFTGILTPNEQHNGFFSIVVTNNNYFVLEMINSALAFSTYNSLGAQKGITDFYYSIISSAEGSHSEKVQKAVMETVKLFNGSIIYHEIKR